MVRALKDEEAREVTAMVRRIAAIILVHPALDENYRRASAKAYEWPGERITAGGGCATFALWGGGNVGERGCDFA